MSYGKWIAGTLGWAFAGPLGGLVGFAVGTLFDKAATMPLVEAQGQFKDKRRAVNSQPGDFVASLLVLTAAVMKADNKVLKSELDFVRQFFVRQFGENQAQSLLIALRELLTKEIPIAEVCHQIKSNLDHASRLQLMHYLFGISNADGHIHHQEVEIISKIAYYLGIADKDFNSIKAMFIKDSKAAYAILESSETATDEEIKKAYRKMAVKYHPDKINHLGEDFQKAAKEKFQEVQNAYEQIKKERGLH